jgi:hypothetical protein
VRRYLEIGGVAQLGERLLCKQDVIGSIPFTSTKILVVQQGSEAAYREAGFRVKSSTVSI